VSWLWPSGHGSREKWTRERGGTRVALNVFGPNLTARSLTIRSATKSSRRRCSKTFRHRSGRERIRSYPLTRLLQRRPTHEFTLADGGDHGVDPVIGEYALEKRIAGARGWLVALSATRIAPGTIFGTITS